MAAHLLTGCLVLLAAAQGAPPSPLEEVMANVQGQPLGAGTVADLALPEDLLRRLSDRILRRSFEESFRIVVDAPAAGAPAAAEEAPGRGVFRTVLDVLALLALGVLLVLGFFAWKARARRKG
ncbi:MAG: hypothetical protein JNK02_10715 [Planctomycetes bacterium]|nr:hypothetical protein [Planctomycetota bacterium]